MRFDRLVLIHLLWLLPVAFWPGSNSYDSLKFTVLGVAAALWLGHAAWRGLQGNLTLNFSTRSLFFAGTFTIVLGCGMFTAANQGLVLRTGLLISLFVFVGVKTMRQSGCLQGQNTLLTAVTGGASAVALYGIMQITGLLPGAPESSGYPAGISTLGNQNYLAGFMAISIWPALVLFRQTSGQRKRIISTASLIIIFSALCLAGATGPLVALPAAMILICPCIVLVHRGYDKIVPALLGGLVLLACVTGAVLMWDATSSQTAINHSPKPHQALFAANHGNVRLADWLAALNMMEQGSIIGGVGAGNYLVKWPISRANLNTTNFVSSLPWGQPVSTKAHNDLLQWAAETGLMGLVWLGLAALWLGRLWQQRFARLECRGQVNHLLLTGGLLTVAVHSSVSFPFHLPATSLVIVFLMGLLFLDENPTRQALSHNGARAFGMILAMASIVLLIGSLQEFRGDLLTASGSRHFTGGHMKKAVVQLEKGVKLMRWPGHGHLYLGLTRSALGQDEKGEYDFRRSLNDRPSFEAHLALAELAINHGDFSSAEGHLQLVKACRPQPEFYFQAGYLHGLLLLRQGNLQEAKRALSELISEDPKRHRALLGLGYVETLLGNTDLARIQYGNALRVIDERISNLQTTPQREAASSLIRLKQNRLVTIKALEALIVTP